MGSLSSAFDQAVRELTRALQANTKVQNKAVDNVKNAAISGALQTGSGLIKGAAALPGRVLGAVNRVGGRAGDAGVAAAAAATDIKNLSGFGSPAALNGILDSFLGKPAGDLLRNVSGLSKIQGKTGAQDLFLNDVIEQNALSGVQTSREEVKNALARGTNYFNTLEQGRAIARQETSKDPERDPLYQVSVAAENLTKKLADLADAAGVVTGLFRLKGGKRR